MAMWIDYGMFRFCLEYGYNHRVFLYAAQHYKFDKHPGTHGSIESIVYHGLVYSLHGLDKNCPNIPEKLCPGTCL